MSKTGNYTIIDIGAENPDKSNESKSGEFTTIDLESETEQTNKEQARESPEESG